MLFQIDRKCPLCNCSLVLYTKYFIILNKSYLIRHNTVIENKLPIFKGLHFCQTKSGLDLFREKRFVYVSFSYAIIKVGMSFSVYVELTQLFHDCCILHKSRLPRYRANLSRACFEQITQALCFPPNKNDLVF